jgi:hypothetical protein
MMETRQRFPPPWSVDDPQSKLSQDFYVVRDANGQALAYVYARTSRAGVVRPSATASICLSTTAVMGRWTSL